MPIIWAADVATLKDGGAVGEVIGGAAGEAGETRRARFGALPERVPFEDMVAEQPAGPANQAVDAYDPDGVGVRFSCLAADLGL
jgi:hypothetical protein